MTDNSPSTSKTQVLPTNSQQIPILVNAIHLENSVDYSMKYYDKIFKTRMYDGMDCAEKFVNMLDTDVADILGKIDEDVSIIPEFVTMTDSIPSASEAAQARLTDLESKPVVVYAKFIVSTALPEDWPATINKESIVVPYRFIYTIKCTFNDELSETRTYQGLDCVKKFYHNMEADLDHILKQTDEDITDVPLFLYNFANDGPEIIEMVAKNKNGKSVRLRVVDPIRWKQSTRTIMKNLDHQVKVPRNWEKLDFKAHTGTCAEMTDKTSSPSTSKKQKRTTDLEKMPVVVYAKFDTIISVPDDPTAYGRPIDVPYSFGYIIKRSFNNELSKLQTYQGLDCAEKFYDYLDNDLADILNQTDEDVSVIPVFLQNFSNYDDSFFSRVLGIISSDDVSIDGNKLYESPLKTKAKNGKEVCLRFVDAKLLKRSTTNVEKNVEQVKSVKGHDDNGDENNLKEWKGLCAKMTDTTFSPSTSKNQIKLTYLEVMPVVVYAKFGTIFSVAEDFSTSEKIINVPCSYFYVIKCSSNDELSEVRTYQGVDCADHFLDCLDKDVANIINQTDKDVTVIPVILRNFSNYDDCFFSRELGAKHGAKIGNLSIGSYECYQSFLTTKTKNGKEVCLRFVVTKNVAADVKQEKLTEGCNISEDEINLKTQKGIVINSDRKEKLPVVVYADFETFMAPLDDSSTTNIGKDIPNGFAYYVKCSENDELSILRTYHGMKCAENFNKTLVTDVSTILKQINDDNISYIPVFIYNLTKYNTVFFLRLMMAGKGESIGNIRHEHDFVNMSSFIYKELTTKNKNGVAIQLRFIDTAKLFLRRSPTNLAENMAREKLITSLKYWDSVEKLDLITKTCLVPRIKSQEDLQQTSLLPKELLYSCGIDCNVSEEDYQRAISIWKLFKCETMRDYLDIYAKSYVLVFADLFEHFRRECMEKINLDPAKYFDTSGFLWDAMLQFTGMYVMLGYYYFCNK